jgi:hypothetical protein
MVNDERAKNRAENALKCLPFRIAFYKEIAHRALSSTEMCRLNASRRLCKKILTPEQVEAHWIWLIKLGIMRREVDGQGLTKRVRLTPMGRNILLRWSGEISKATIFDRLKYFLIRLCSRA